EPTLDGTDFCTNCGAKVPPGVDFCTNCGSKINR
ncbi:MAG: zinc-ribbon domain-containing protein, partial [Promethearchaeota archaeon]